MTNKALAKSSGRSESDRVFAPGARVEIRDEEWTVRSSKPASHGGLAVSVVGISELVRGKEAIFLTELDLIKELKPEETKLVYDHSTHFRQSRLYLESLLRQTPATDDALYIGHRAAIRPTDYQLQPAAKALGQLRPRILMADGVGLGKTIEVGVLLSELIYRGRADRILVVALKSILAQFQEELWARFTIPLVRLDSVGIQRVQSKIPSSSNPFYHYDRVIISIDTLKRDAKYRRYLEECRWDVVVVDECQNVAVRTSGGFSQRSQRARLAQLLSRTTDALIFTSATPHDGRAPSFASLINLLEPTAIADPNNYTADDVSKYFLRRFKKDIKHEIDEAFKDREPRLQKVPASSQEDAAFALFPELEFKTIARSRGGKGVLFRTTLLKAFLSSPAACLETIEKRLQHKAMQEEASEEVEHDRKTLGHLRSTLETISAEGFSKYRALLSHLRDLGFDRPIQTERIVVFSERLATLRYLREHLLEDLGIPKSQIATFHGTLDDQSQQQLVKSFGSEDSPIRILLASDVASEGINLHYYCHRLVHFDLPWSLITLEQRNGRIDRFGQTETPYLTYLLTIPGDDELKGDLRVLERLIEKEAAAHENLGDVAWLLDLHDAEKEEEHIGRGLEAGDEAEEILPDEPQYSDFMSLLDDEDEAPPPEKRQPVRLFRDDLRYARAAFREIFGGSDSAESPVEWFDHLDGFEITFSPDLARRYDLLPPELTREGDSAKLTTDRQKVMEALDKSRQEERKWPEWQLFWEQHPVSEWLNDRVLAHFGRHEAPTVELAGRLAPGTAIFLFQGVLSNRRSQPVIVDWFCTEFENGELTRILSLNELIERTGIDGEPPNPESFATDRLANLAELLPRAVSEAADHMNELRLTRFEAISKRLKSGLDDVARWRQLRLEGLEEAKRDAESGGRKLSSPRLKKLQSERDETEKAHTARKQWIEEGLRTVPEPYLRVAAAFVGPAA